MLDPLEEIRVRRLESDVKELTKQLLKLNRVVISVLKNNEIDLKKHGDIWQQFINIESKLEYLNNRINEQRQT